MTKKNFIIAALAAVTTFTAAFTTSNIWNADKAHAELGFTINHLGINDVSGFISDFDAHLTATKKDFSDGVFELKANVASIDTRIDARDNHLKSADFFDVEKYPNITYKSTSIKKISKDKYKLKGNLTIKGVTKAVDMDMVYRGTVENPMSKKPTAGFKLTGKIKRSDFGVGSGFPAPMLSDEVRIEANGEFAQ